MSALIKADELHAIHQNGNVKILDGSYGQPEFPMGIDGAVDFNIDIVADLTSRLSHTLPSPDIFADQVGKMGISNSDTVVVYDRSGIAMAASRVWWMFRVFGHDNVKVLDGGLPAWVNAGFPLSPKNHMPEVANFAATFRPELFKQQNDMLENIKTNAFTVIDARDARRFSGDMPEPRPGMGAGHIPGSLNVPFMNLINADGTLKDRQDLQRHLGTSLDKPVATSCGSGVTAGVVTLALFELGQKDVAIYGGSWTEWGGNPGLPKKQGTEP